ncbi:MAG: PTS sugar transporter subunit IIC [Trichococcus flocculiformis]|uniref:Permease IIC component n=1 Tax=Trichococcus flocculiformis TaxID=82803 RepID=A0A847D1T6_9LACT|nr:PTS transporter subunit EIIC [Trichococcus flocculiformis]NLD31281.1 PTS sugar transporter subunit IIC [Trichococcus flocculiformis]
MKHFINFMENRFIPVATKISNNKVVRAVSGGSMTLMSIIIVGAIFSLLNTINIPVYQEFLAATGLSALFAFVPGVTINAIGLYMVFFVAYQGSLIYGKKDGAVNTAILALVSFLILIPLTEIMEEGAFQPIIYLNTSYIGSRGAFTAIITGLLVAKIYQLVIDKNWTIKMGEDVPPQVAKAFLDIIPAFIILSLFALVRWGFSFTSFGSATDFVYSILQTPLQTLTSSVPAFVILILVAQLLWFFGIHGSYTILPILMPIWMGYIQDNIAAYQAGLPIPHIFNIALYDLTTIGGAGSTLGFVIVMALFAKSQQYKKFSKLVLLPGLFNINEPLIFGMPIILNPLVFVPFVFTPIIIILLGYAAIVIGIMPAPTGMFIPASTPIVFSGLMQGGWKIAVFQVFAVALSAGIYYPFFKLMDKQALANERSASADSIENQEVFSMSNTESQEA